jgi:hypothetical protein
VRADQKRKGLLFAGTERGVFYSVDDGAHWKSLQLNLPMSSMRDLAVKDNDLVVATHGRSFWVLDDITPLREMTPESQTKSVFLYPPAAAYRIVGGPGGQNKGSNPPNGVVIYYNLKNSLKKDDKQPESKATDADKSADEKKTEPRLKLEILDADGKVIRKYPEKRVEGATETEGPPQPLNNPGLEAGLNRFNWDMRYERVAEIPNTVLWGGGIQGPIAMPGKYQVRLIVDGQAQTQPVELRADPRLEVSLADLQKQFDLLKNIQAKVGQAHEAVNQIREVRKQMTDLNKRLAQAKDPRQKQLEAAGKKIEEKMKSVEEELVQVKSKTSQDPLNYGLKLNNQMAALGGDVENVGSVPTQQAYTVYEMLAGKIDAQISKWSEIKNNDLKEFNQIAREVPAVLVTDKTD